MRIVVLAIVTTLTAASVALVLALGGDDVRSSGQAQPAGDLRSQAQTSSLAGTSERSVRQAGSNRSAATVPGTRYDGGPEEGSRGTNPASPANPGRPDGGPEEGTRGPGH